MSTAADLLGRDPVMVMEFLKKTVPFNELDSESSKTFHNASPRFFPKETSFPQEVDDVDHFYLIQKGGVKAYLTGPDEAETLLDFRGEGGYFGLLQSYGRPRQISTSRRWKTPFVWSWIKSLSWISFARILAFKYYLKRFSEDLVRTAYTELRSRKISARPQEMLYLFNVETGDVISRPPEIVHASQTIRQAAERMSELEIGSLLVQDQAARSLAS